MRWPTILACGALWLAGAALVCLPAVGWAQGDCAPGFECYSIPEYVSWQNLQQPAADTTVYVRSISFAAAPNGIAPMDTVWTVPVPDVAGAASVAELDGTTASRLAAFPRYVARDSLFALNDVVEGGQTVVQAGQLLVPAYTGLPGTLDQVRRLRLAGIQSVRALVNLTHTIYRSRIAYNLQAFSDVVKSPTIYERQIDFNAKRQLLINLFDTNPLSGFTRIDLLNRPAEKRAIVITMNMVARYPVRMVRFYSIPRSVPYVMAGFQLEAHDGLSYKRGQELVDINQPRLGAGVVSTDLTYKEGDLPVWTTLITTEKNLNDTVQVFLPKVAYFQQFKFRSLTALDYDIGEFEVFGEGFVPSTQFLSRAMCVRREGISNTLAYLNGDFTKRTALDQLKGGTLGRIFWDEQKVGNSGKSSAQVYLQTGNTPEPNILYRLNGNGDVVPWRVDAKVIDRRANSVTSGQLVNLDDANLRASAPDVWNALSADDRKNAQTTTPEYAALATANKKDKNGILLAPEPDLTQWTGFQPVTNGQMIPVAAERPFYQIKVDFNSEEPGAATYISNLRFEHLYPPALQRVTGEIVPATGVTGGRDTLFTYALRPGALAGDKGFDRIRIETPVAIERVESVEYGYGTPQALARREAVTFEQLALADSFFVVGVPRVNAAAVRNDSLVVLIRFSGRVLSTKTTFGGQVFLDDFGARDSTDYGRIVTLFQRDAGSGQMAVAGRILPQKVLTGDVLAFGADAGDRNSLEVVTRVDAAVEGVVMRAEVAPNPFTPNGDGVNDVVLVTFDILRVVRPVPVRVELFDLSGRLVRAFLAPHAIGMYSQQWDGKDEAGQLVAPGLYVVQVRAETDAGDVVSSRLVAVAY